MQSFSTHVLLHTKTGDLFVYDFKDHDWQRMEGVKNFLVLKSGNLLITYNGRYEIYNKNFLLIFFKDVDFIGFLTMIEQFQSMFEIGKDQVAILSGCGNWHMIDACTYEKHLQDPVKMPYINVIRYSNFFHCVHSNDGRFSFLANHDKIFVFDHKTFMLHHEIKAKEIVKAMFYIESEQVKEPILMVVYTTFAEVIQTNGLVIMRIQNWMYKSTQIHVVKQHPTIPTKFMFGTKPFDLLDPWKGNQLAMICLYRAINDFNQTVSKPMIDYINQVSFLP